MQGSWRSEPSERRGTPRGQGINGQEVRILFSEAPLRGIGVAQSVSLSKEASGSES